jgi:hypothetical protein
LLPNYIDILTRYSNPGPLLTAYINSLKKKSRLFSTAWFFNVTD